MKNVMKIRTLFAIALLLLTQQAVAWKGDGTNGNPYQIETQADWDDAQTFGKSDTYWEIRTDIMATEMKWVGDNVVIKGNDHTITIDIDGSDAQDGVALFFGGKGVQIWDLKLKGTIKGKGTHTASLITSLSDGWVRNVHSEVVLEAVAAGDTWGGLIGYIGNRTQGTNTTRVDESSFVGKILDNGFDITSCAGLIGNSESAPDIRITSCLTDLRGSTVKGARNVLNNKGGYKNVTFSTVCYVLVYGKPEDQPGALAFSGEEAASGKLCYYLNEEGYWTSWRQELGVDTIPYYEDNDRPLVYRASEEVYVNLPQKGIGTDKEPFIIESAKDWLSFAAIQRNYKFTNNEWALGQDLTLSIQEKKDTLLLVDKFEHGTMNGNGHTLNMIIKTLDRPNQALFGLIKKCAIKNLNLTGHVSARGKSSAGLAKTACYVRMDSVYSDVVVEQEQEETGCDTWGGFFGYIVKGGEEEEIDTTSFNMCTYVGKLLGKVQYCGGFAGFASEGVPVRLDKCIVDITGSTVTDSRDIMRNHEDFKHVRMHHTCYVLNNPVKGDPDPQPGAIPVAYEDMASGKACFLLNEKEDHNICSQNLGEDRYPQFNNSRKNVLRKDTIYYNRSYVRLGSRFDTGYMVSDDTQIYSVHEFLPTMQYFLYSEDLVFSYEIIKQGGMRQDEANPSCNRNAGTINDLFDEYCYTPYEVYLDTKRCTRAHPCNSAVHSEEKTLVSDKMTPRELSICETSIIYDFVIMEKGRQMHHFIPAEQGGKGGFYDVVTNSFHEVDGEVFINPTMCEHPYTEIIREKGVEKTHCKLCDKYLDTKYYAVVHFDDNLQQRLSRNAAYNKVYGAMMDQTIDGADTLKANLFRRPMYVFGSWNTKADGTGKAFVTGKEFVASEELHDSLTLYAQWLPAYQCNGDSLRPLPAEGTALERLDIVDNGVDGFAAAEDFVVDSLSFTMTPKVGHVWGTICLPFDFHNDEAQTGLVLYTDGEVLGDSIILDTSAADVRAGTPAIFHLNAPATGAPITLRAAQRTVSETVGENTTESNFHLSGVLDYHYVKCDTTVNTYYGIMYDKFYRVNTTITLHPYRAYFYVAKAPQSVPAYNILLQGEVTCVQALPEGTGYRLQGTDYRPQEAKIYDLQGRRLAAPHKGVNIINGKKVIR